MNKDQDVIKSNSPENEFARIVSNFPLIAPAATAAGMANYNYASSAGSNLYFGTGLSTRTEMTRGLPFDFLGMLVGAEFTRRKLGLKTIVQEIFDAPSIESGFAPAAEVACVAKEQKALIEKMTTKLGLGNAYKCMLASEYQSTPTYAKILSAVQDRSPNEGRYFQSQWAGMNWMATEEGTRVKLGWVMDDSRNPRMDRDLKLCSLDEQRFDFGYGRLEMAPLLSYVYVKSGRNISPKRMRVSPYISVTGEDRIMLAQGQDAASYFERWLRQPPPTKDTRLTLTNLANIVDGFESLFGSIKGIGSIWTDSKTGRANSLVLSAGSKKPRVIDTECLGEKINAIFSRLDLDPEASPRGRSSDFNMIVGTNVRASAGTSRSALRL